MTTQQKEDMLAELKLKERKDTINTQHKKELQKYIFATLVLWIVLWLVIPLIFS